MTMQTAQQRNAKKKLYIVNSEEFARADVAASSFKCVITVCEIVDQIVC